MSVMSWEGARAAWGEMSWHGYECSLEDGPPDDAGRPQLWLGVDRIVFEGGERSWSVRARMLLGQDHVGELVPALAHWLRRGTLGQRRRVPLSAALLEAALQRVVRLLERELGDDVDEALRAKLRRCLRAALDVEEPDVHEPRIAAPGPRSRPFAALDEIRQGARCPSTQPGDATRRCGLPRGHHGSHTLLIPTGAPWARCP